MSKKRNQLGTTIDSDIHELVKDLSNTIGIPVSKLTDQAFGLLLDKYEDGGFVDPRKRTDRTYRFTSMDEISASTLDEAFEEEGILSSPYQDGEIKNHNSVFGDYISNYKIPEGDTLDSPLTNKEIDEFHHALSLIREKRNRIVHGIKNEDINDELGLYDLELNTDGDLELTKKNRKLVTPQIRT